jgi:tRNA-specific 2-thiouridylase
VAGLAPAAPVRARVKIRYRDGGMDAELDVRADAVRVLFDEPVRAVTPGQAAVFYVGDEVLGGGWIAGEIR